MLDEICFFMAIATAVLAFAGWLQEMLRKKHASMGWASTAFFMSVQVVLLRWPK